MKRPAKLSRRAARRIALRTQLLDESTKLPEGSKGALAIVERVGYVQIDTIAVVERAHHHVLWSRQHAYRPHVLDELLSRDRSVFEYWRRAASYLPTSDYRYYTNRMRGARSSPGCRDWIKSNKKVVSDVRRRIRKEGPLPSSAFASPDGRKRGPWWDWKPAKRALEILFDMGELMVSARRNFQRLYDLTERVLPGGVDTSAPTPEEHARFEVRRALACHGLAQENEIRWAGWKAKDLAGTLQDLLGTGEVVSVLVEKDESPYYALERTLKAAKTSTRRKPTARILSPFDSLVIERRRLRRLFDFDCKLECYFPEAKRTYGYFCLPVLLGDEFIGRIDAKAHRKEKVLDVKALILEPGFRDYDTALPALARELNAFAAFNGCDEVRISRAKPTKAAPPLKRLLKRDS